MDVGRKRIALSMRLGELEKPKDGTAQAARVYRGGPGTPTPIRNSRPSDGGAMAEALRHAVLAKTKKRQ